MRIVVGMCTLPEKFFLAKIRLFKRPCNRKEARMTDTLHRYAALLFDFDGTLADSYAAIAASVNHVRGLRGLPPLTVDEVKRHVGRGADYLLTQTVPGGRLADDLAAYRVHHPS